MTCYGRVLRGFEYPLLKFAVISESDIFGSEKKKRKKKKTYEGRKINDFNELSIGDYVVHENHGLGIYKGIEKVEVDKVTKDYIKIEYRDGGTLYVLATASMPFRSMRLQMQKSQSSISSVHRSGAEPSQRSGKQPARWRRIWWSFMRRVSRKTVILTERIRSGRGNLKRCFPLRRRRISCLPLMRRKRTWRARRSWTA